MKPKAWALWVLQWMMISRVMGASVGAAIDTPDDCQMTGAGGDKVSLICRLRTINSELDTTNFSVIPARVTISLEVECSDVLFFQSALRNKSFVQLTRLRQLQIEYCKIGEVPRDAFAGLGNLQNLTLKTFNTDWSAMTLSIAPDAFYHQTVLENLDLGDNNIWTLPPRLFCGLGNLTMLNLSRNRLQDINDLSFNNAIKKCAPRLRQLDLSFNHFNVVPPFAFSALKNLTSLNLSLNGIQDLADQALFGMYSLEVLDISGNLLSTLPPELFKENKRLTKLYARNNSITVLAPGLFTGLYMLLELNLADNDLTNTWVNSETFMDLLRLASLDLSHNKISRLDAATFRDLTNLQVLNMERNQLESINDNTFSGLFRLHTLILSENRLKLLTDLTLEGLVELAHLRLDFNQIFSVDSDALRNSTKLKDLHLSNNYLQEVPLVLKKLRNLLSLDLSGNSISEVMKRSFKDLQQLTVLNLANNEIETISKEVFKYLAMLRVLNLSQNKIRTIENGAFDHNHNLKAIRVDDNVLTNVHGLFSDLSQLKWLNLSKNHLEMFDYAFIPLGLEYLDLRSNLINELGNYFELESQLSLRILDASFNKLREVSSSSIPDSVEIIFLNNNLISQIQPYTFFKKKNLTRVDLFSNLLQHLDQNALRLSVLEPSKSQPEFYIGENPLQCDCTLQWLQKINGPEEIRQTPRIVDLAAITCRLLNARGQGLLSLLEVHKLQFLCKYESHCPSLCHCCDFDACDCEMTCPTNCTCFHDASWTANIVDCSGTKLVAVPDRIPMDASEVYLDGNSIESLSSHTFIGRKNLQVLFLNNSSINTVYNRTFNGLKQLQILYINDNNLKSLKGYEFENLVLMRELYLHNNQLMSIHNTTFSTLIALKMLRIDGNLLSVFSFNQLSPSLISIRIGRNPWTCECSFLDQLKYFLFENEEPGKISVDSEEVYCIENGTSLESGEQITAYNSSECGTKYIEKTTLVRDRDPSDSQILVPVATLSGVALFLLIFFFVFCNRNRIRVYMHAKHGVRLFYKNDRSEDSSKVFDAFVSYSSKDEVFVTQILAPELERGSPSYKLCLHYRDFPVGAYVTDSILSAVESSKRTVLILSDNFIKSEWMRYEFRSAHHEVLRDRCRRLIVILLGEVSMGDLDPDLRLYLKTNTWLRWGDANFWHKLKFAMPDARPPSRTHQLRAIQQQECQEQSPSETAVSQTSIPAQTTCHYTSQTQPQQTIILPDQQQVQEINLQHITSHQALHQHVHHVQHHNHNHNSVRHAHHHHHRHNNSNSGS
ncbi:toll-like receptor Tollo [Hyalella azteca]|uniref:Toll-like receptor Tollo n=1 Tax=Hyalella azteca TaxID=294128 RepID=A0A8B7NMX6_HYAAZ|nr:toll-like receptor Tollo [Hyalella azteca]